MSVMLCWARLRRIFAKRLPRSSASHRIECFRTAACRFAKRQIKVGLSPWKSIALKASCDKRLRDIMAMVQIHVNVRASSRDPAKIAACALAVTEHDDASWGSDGFDGDWPARVPWTRSLQGEPPSRRLRKVCKADAGLVEGMYHRSSVQREVYGLKRRNISSSLCDARTCTFNGKYRWRVTRTSSFSFIRISIGTPLRMKSLVPFAADSFSTKIWRVGAFRITGYEWLRDVCVNIISWRCKSTWQEVIFHFF